jgi:hypothetical protein
MEPTETLQKGRFYREGAKDIQILKEEVQDRDFEVKRVVGPGGISQYVAIRS